MKKSNRFLLLAVSLFLCIAIYVNNIVVLSALIFIGAYYSFRIAGKDISTPGVWFVLAIWLYHYSVPILAALGEYDPSYSPELIRVPTICIALTFLMVGFAEKKYQPRIDLGDVGLNFSGRVYRFFFVLELGYIFTTVFFVGGSKTEIALLGLARLQIFQALFVTAFAGYLVKKAIRGEDINRFLIFNAAFAFFASAATGERDVFAAMVMIGAICLVRYSRTGALRVATFVALGGALFTVLQTLRNFFSAEDSSGGLERNILVEFFAGEPRSAAQNFNILVEHLRGADYLGLQYFLNDILSIFIPKSVFYLENSLNWFNQTFFAGVVEIGGGVGYSLIGNIYSYNGEYLVYPFFALLAFALIRIRAISSYKPLYFAFYVSCVPLLVYSMRGDVSTLFGSILRTILPVFLIYSLLRFLSRRSVLAKV